MRKWVITCEHAGNEVPDPYQWIFEERPEILLTHKGMDIGSKVAFDVFKTKADHVQVHTTTRLLIELNRSLHHPNLFSEFSRKLSPEEKLRLIDSLYFPYRQRLEDQIRQYMQSGNEVIHVSVHTFTPVLAGHVRNADIGFLYDPSRNNEKIFCRAWKDNVKRRQPDLKVRFNYPYLGKADGLTTALRKKFPRNYIGIELEINQKHEKAMSRLAALLLSSLP